MSLIGGQCRKSNQLRCREVHLNKQSLSSEFKRIRDQSDRDSIKAIQTTLGISKDDPEKLVHQITIDAKNINDIILNLPDDFIYYRGRGSQEEITQTHSPHFTPYIESAYSHSLRDRQGYSLVNYVLAKNLKEIIKKSQLKVHFDKSIGNIEIVSQGPANWYYSLELDKYYFLTK